MRFTFLTVAVSALMVGVALAAPEEIKQACTDACSSFALPSQCTMRCLYCFDSAAKGYLPANQVDCGGNEECQTAQSTCWVFGKGAEVGCPLDPILCAFACTEVQTNDKSNCMKYTKP